jgi:hypothetical protein
VTAVPVLRNFATEVLVHFGSSQVANSLLRQQIPRRTLSRLITDSACQKHQPDGLDCTKFVPSASRFPLPHLS